MKFKAEEPRLPFPFNLIPYFIAAVAVVVLGIYAVAIYWAATTDISPEEIGSFFGRVVQGFEQSR